MENAAGLGGVEDVGGFFGGGAGDDVGVGEDEDGVAFHELGLGHGGVPWLVGGGGGGWCWCFFRHGAIVIYFGVGCGLWLFLVSVLSLVQFVGHW